MDYRVIIFDKDGTLLDFDKFWLAVSDGALSDIIKAASVNVTKESLLESMGVHNGITDISGILCRGTYAQMGTAIYGVLSSAGCKLSEDEVKALTVEAYHNNYSKGEITPTCENIKEVLGALRAMGAKLAVITTDDSFVTKKCLDALGISEYFEFLLCDDGEFPPKPDPYGIKYIINRYNVTKSEILMVGDTITDMLFAKNGGVQAIGVGKTESAKKILGEYTNLVYDDISFIPESLK